MEERIGWFIIIFAVILILALGIRFLPAGMYSGLAVIGVVICYALDQLFSASLIHGAPWVMWVIGGGVIGSAFAFWTVAPIFGLRQRRPLIMGAPFALLLLLAIIRVLIS